MRGRADFIALFATWPARGRAVREIKASAIPTVLVLEINRFRISTSSIIS
jgi:hypothetical protein